METKEFNEAFPGPQNPSDKRHALRLPVIVLKIIEGDSRDYLFGYAKNISPTGLFIQSINPRKMGERFTISFYIPSTDIGIRCRCEVVWVREYNKKDPIEPGYGIRFMDLPEDLVRQIEQWVSKQKFHHDLDHPHHVFNSLNI